MLSLALGQLNTMTEGSLNPWHPKGEPFEFPVWEDEVHQTPFGALAIFLEEWPGTTQTSEQSDPVRHRRLVETLAGYPEIFSGRRPLDVPLHPKSVLAFKLALFLDKIPSTGPSEWHSLKSVMLYADLLDKQIETKAKQFLHQTMLGIREHSRFRCKETMTDLPYEKSLHDDEVRFLTVLHSQNWRRVQEYWPLKLTDEILGSSDGILEFAYFSGDDDKNYEWLEFNGAKGKWLEHEFKFKSIQSWISAWAGINVEFHPLNENVAHNLIIGASTMLESIFAKMRSHILKEKKVGSIVIDGGGRISFLSKTNSEEERKEFNQQLYSILYLDPDHPHPYQTAIKDAMNRYIGFEKVRSFLGNQTDLPLYEELDDGTYVLKKKGFERLFNKEYMANVFPEISEIEDDAPSIDYAKRMNKTQEGKACLFCQKTASVEQVGEQEGCRDSVSKWLKDSYVCPIHYLLFAIGEAAQIRMGSRYDLQSSAPTRFKVREKTVQQMILFDGNSIGGWFKKPFDHYLMPQLPCKVDNIKEQSIKMPYWEINSSRILAYWEEQKDTLLNLRDRIETPSSKDFDGEFPDEWVNGVEEIETKPMSLQACGSKADAFAREIMFRRRMQAMIRRQRRSFHFNATWWTTLKDGLNHMIPWVLAGDDLVLVNSKRLEDKEILDVLGKLHNLLSKNFPHTPLTFAGALLTRGESSIRDMYREASHLEDEAGYLWKFLVAENEKLPSLSDKKEQKKKAWLTKKTEVGKNLPRLIENIKLFTVGEEGSVPSIILQRDWYQDLQKMEEEEE